MALDRDQLHRHLLEAAQAYGDDLQLPMGKAIARTEAARPGPAPSASPAIRAAAAQPSASAPAPSAPPPQPHTTNQPAARPTPLTPTQPTPTQPKPTQPTPAAGDRDLALATLRAEVAPCTKCKLCKTRTHTVFGEGAATAEAMFIGEAPGAQEDLAGRPFVGPAGQLLDRILENAMGLRRDHVFIANVNKCRPPGNRDPEPDEVAACLPFLRQQIKIVQPKVIVCLGRIAARNLLDTTQSVTALRQQELSFDGTPVVVTWHPAFLLRDPSHKRETWDDIKRVNRLLGRPEVPPAPGA